QQFVANGVGMLRVSNNVKPRVVSMVRYHCERHDGSGFPEGLSGGKSRYEPVLHLLSS
ncbi:MAG: response regulator RpfG family c-di-GMP phosphodiesterase, partial [Porticoccus sp.]